MATITTTKLKEEYKKHNPKGHFFDTKTMKFFGDTIRNFFVVDGDDTWDLFRKNDAVPNNGMIGEKGYFRSFSKKDFRDLLKIKKDFYAGKDMPDTEKTEKNSDRILTLWGDRETLLKAGFVTKDYAFNTDKDGNLFLTRKNSDGCLLSPPIAPNSAAYKNFTGLLPSREDKNAGEENIKKFIARHISKNIDNCLNIPAPPVDKFHVFFHYDIFTSDDGKSMAIADHDLGQDNINIYAVKNRYITDKFLRETGQIGKNPRPDKLMKPFDNTLDDYTKSVRKSYENQENLSGGPDGELALLIENNFGPVDDLFDNYFKKNTADDALAFLKKSGLAEKLSSDSYAKDVLFNPSLDFKELDEWLSGRRADFNEERRKLKNEALYIKQIKDKCVKSLENGTSVLLHEHDGVDYSVNSVSGKAFSGIGQILAQQFRRDNGYSDPNFVPYYGQDGVKIKKNQKGLMLNETDNGVSQQKIFFNHDQTEKHPPALKPKKTGNDYPVSGGKNDHIDAFRADMARYFYHLFNGGTYIPSRETTENSKLIAEEIQKGTVSMTIFADEAYKRAVKPRRKTDGRAVTGIKSKGRA